MARTNYDPLEKHPYFDGTLDPELDDPQAGAGRGRKLPVSSHSSVASAARRATTPRSPSACAAQAR